MKESQAESKSDTLWQKTKYTNLVRYVPSGILFARFKVRGKLIRQSLKTPDLELGKRRLIELEKQERGAADQRSRGKITFGEALEIHMDTVRNAPDLKPRTKSYYEERKIALYKSWPELEALDVRKIAQKDCTAWRQKFAAQVSATAFNHTLAMMRKAFDCAIAEGARTDNPARAIERMTETPKKVTLPDGSKFDAFVAEIEKGGSGWSQPCADLVRFMAYGGFRKSEAANVRWRDCDFTGGKIRVYGNPETGLKGRSAGDFRDVPMIPDMRKLLERIKEERTEAQPAERVMQVQECQKAMDRAHKKVGMKRITHHDLRHLFATRCIEAGVDIPTVSRWLGHKDGGALAMKVYGHLRDQHSQAMAAKVTFSEKEAA